MATELEKRKSIVARRGTLARVFQHDEKDARLQLELLKLTPPYIEFFSTYRAKVAAAYIGLLADDEEVWNALAFFYWGLRNRFGIDIPTPTTFAITRSGNTPAKYRRKACAPHSDSHIKDGIIYGH